MKWKPFLAGALRSKLLRHAEQVDAFSRRGACVRRQSAHLDYPLQASRRVASHRLLGA